MHFFFSIFFSWYLWAAAPDGMKYCRTQGECVHPSVHRDDSWLMDMSKQGKGTADHLLPLGCYQYPFCFIGVICFLLFYEQGFPKKKREKMSWQHWNGLLWAELNQSNAREKESHLWFQLTKNTNMSAPRLRSFKKLNTLQSTPPVWGFEPL